MSKPPRHTASPWLVLAAILLGTLSGTLGNSVANVAVPAIMREFHTPLASSVWVVSLYTLLFAVLMPVGGYLGDVWGQRRMYLLGMSLLSVAALSSGLAPSFPWLLVSRGFMGAGVAPTLPAIMAIIARTFPPERRGRAMGFWALANSGGHALGPLISGFLTQHLGWRSVFLVNIPLCLLTIVMVAWLVPPEGTPRRSEPFDFGGAAALTIAALSLMLALTRGSQIGWTSSGSLLLWVLALLALPAFVAREKRTAKPLVDLALFRNRYYMAALGAISAEIFCMFGLLVALPVFLIQDQGWPSQSAGLLVFPLPLAMALISPLAGRLADTRGVRFTATVGASLMGAAALALLGVLAWSGPFVHWWGLVACLVTMGAGMGFIQSPSAATSIQVVAADQVGAASGVFHMGRFLSGSLGSTVFGLMLQGYGDSIAAGFRANIVLVIIIASLALVATNNLPGARRRSDEGAVE